MYNALGRIDNFLERKIDEGEIRVPFIPLNALVSFFEEKSLVVPTQEGDSWSADWFFEYEGRAFRVYSPLVAADIVVEFLGEK